MKNIQIFWLALVLFLALTCTGFFVIHCFLYDLTKANKYLIWAIFSGVIAIANIYNAIRMVKRDQDELHEVK